MIYRAKYRLSTNLQYERASREGVIQFNREHIGIPTISPRNPITSTTLPPREPAKENYRRRKKFPLLREISHRNLARDFNCEHQNDIKESESPSAYARARAPHFLSILREVAARHRGIISARRLLGILVILDSISESLRRLTE